MSQPAESGGTPRKAHGARGADEAVVRLWRRHRRWLAAVVYAHKPRQADIEDLLQEVAMKLVQHIHTIDDPEAIRPWLRTVAINIARSAGRKSRSRAKLEGPIDVEHLERVYHEPLALIRGGAVDRSAQMRGRAALKIADGLPPHYREPLLLNLRGLTHKQIAQVLEVPVTTIETRLIRARRMLRDELIANESEVNRSDAQADTTLAGSGL